MPNRSHGSHALGPGAARKAKLPSWLQSVLKSFPRRRTDNRRTGNQPLGDIPAALALKAEFDVDDKVAFDSSDGLLRGTIVRLNPKTARVRVSASSFYRVPYGCLERQSTESREHRTTLLRSVAGQARHLMQHHGFLLCA